MKRERFNQRKIRTRSKVRGTTDRPRLSVYKSNKFMSVQIIDDVKAATIASVSEKSLGKLGGLGKDGLGKAKELGKSLAEKALKLKVKAVVFDKGGYSYHGKIKAIAEGAREGGLEFWWEIIITNNQKENLVKQLFKSIEFPRRQKVEIKSNLEQL